MSIVEVIDSLRSSMALTPGGYVVSQQSFDGNGSRFRQLAEDAAKDEVCQGPLELYLFECRFVEKLQPELFADALFMLAKVWASSMLLARRDVPPCILEFSELLQSRPSLVRDVLGRERSTPFFVGLVDILALSIDSIVALSVAPRWIHFAATLGPSWDVTRDLTRRWHCPVSNGAALALSVLIAELFLTVADQTEIFGVRPPPLWEGLTWENHAWPPEMANAVLQGLSRGPLERAAREVGRCHPDLEWFMAVACEQNDDGYAQKLEDIRLHLAGQGTGYWSDELR